MAIVPKEILRVGKYWTNAGLLTVTPQRLKHFEQSGNAMIKGRLSIPLPYNHQPEAEPTTSQDLANRVKNNTGFASKYYCLGDSLWCDLDVADKEAEGKLNTTIKFVSPKISPVFTDGRGKTWNDVITHIALTPRPRFIDQTPFGTDPNAFYMSDDEGPGVCLSMDNLLSDEMTMPQTSFGASQYHASQHEDHDQKMRQSLDAEKSSRQSGDMASFINHAKNSDYHRAMSQYHAHMASHHAATEHAKYDTEHPEPGSEERLQKNNELAKRSLGHAEKWKDSVVKQGFPDPSHNLSEDNIVVSHDAMIGFLCTDGCLPASCLSDDEIYGAPASEKKPAKLEVGMKMIKDLPDESWTGSPGDSDFESIKRQAILGPRLWTAKHPDNDKTIHRSRPMHRDDKPLFVTTSAVPPLLNAQKTVYVHPHADVLHPEDLQAFHEAMANHHAGLKKTYAYKKSSTGQDGVYPHVDADHEIAEKWHNHMAGIHQHNAALMSYFGGKKAETGWKRLKKHRYSSDLPSIVNKEPEMVHQFVE